MVSLTIDNSICRIYNLNVNQYADLRKLLSYNADPAQGRFSGWKGNSRRYLIDKKGNFPTGLLYLVMEYIHENKLPYQSVECRQRPKRHFDWKPSFKMSPYYEQLDATIHANLGERGIIVAPTGVGKSVICALITEQFGVKTLIVVPSLELKSQLTRSFTEWFGRGAMENIRIENVGALDSKIVDPADLIIIDEFHHSGAKTYRKLNEKAWKNTYYKIGLTATPFRSQDHERLLLESVLSKVIYRIDYKMAVEKKYIVPLEAYYIDLPVSKTKASTWAGVYKELVVENKHRNQVTLDLLGRLHANKCSTLCLVKEIKHGENLSQGLIAFANGQDGFSNTLIQGFNQARLTTLIGTTGVLGEGVDTKPAEYIIIAGLGKSKNAFMQQCGRGFRRYGDKTSCKVILFRDASHKWTLNHFRAQCKVLRDEYGVKPVKLEV